MSKADFQSFQSVEEAEKRLRQATSAEHAQAINSHADAIGALNAHHTQMHAQMRHLQDQMDALLDGVTLNNRRQEAIEARLAVLEQTLGVTHG